MNIHARPFMAALIYIILSNLIISCSNDNSNEQEDDLYVQIPDLNFESKLISLGIDSEGITDQRLLKTDALKVEDLDLNSFGKDEISDLTGIEGFKNLTKLQAEGNSLTTVDLSSNKQLDTLILSGNFIKTIDLSNNTALIKLNLSVNELSSVSGLENAINLKWLSLSYNVLEEFSIQTTALESLFIRDNLLTSLDIQNAESLITLLAQTNRISEIDLTTNTALETLALSDNRIQSVNLEANPEIETLYISSNSLLSLDISNLEKLVFLTVDRNPDLSCIKIETGQTVPNLTMSEYQELNTDCN
ncbi:hypothetical protein GWK08_08595 [Leptobacterium flavescens]|uniref:Leucine-rich repeat domain-containing protein n=1 Tax=Leptobacterium flavescens TaxID=472055 RepID=A0A6P0ULT2_9FLAO|nr:hypothetical protein [Leptobacterium flavescens]NER13492.1 hypothetical protein [Leptobacterium flavescens]